MDFSFLNFPGNRRISKPSNKCHYFMGLVHRPNKKGCIAQKSIILMLTLLQDILCNSIPIP